MTSTINTIDSSGSSISTSVVNDVTASPVLSGIVKNDNFETNLD